MKLTALTSVFGLLFASNVIAQDGAVANGVSGIGSSQDFSSLSGSAEILQMKKWIIDSGNNGRLPFILIDKVDAKVYVFNSAGQLQGSAAALLGMARGDYSPPGIGSRPLSDIGTQDRITPAGRFVSSLIYDKNGKQVLLVDDAEALSLHPVVKGTPAERRAERLQSSTSQDNRISFGCINVPVQFFKTIISPAFTHTHGLVYILPETSPLHTLIAGSQRQSNIYRTNRRGNPLLTPLGTGNLQNKAFNTDRQ